jgi:hypothetical protein
MKVSFVDSQRSEHGVQPVLQALEDTPAQIAPSTYYAAKTRPACARTVRDNELTGMIEQVHAENYGVCGPRKIWARAAPPRHAGGPLHRRTAHARVRGYAGCCATSRPVRPDPRPRPAGPVTWSNATSPRSDRISCGSRT